MSTITKAALAALMVVTGASASFAATYPAHSHRMHYRTAVHDRWFQPLHLDNAGVRAKTYFEQMQTDGE